MPADIHHPKTTRQIVKSFEASAMKKRPLAIKIADTLTSYFGTMEFLIFNIMWFSGWILINTGNIPGITPFDPFPFQLLTTAVSLEAIFLTIIVLMSQNRQSYISTLREELDLQINLLTEREITKVLELLIGLHDHHKIKIDDPELQAMLRKTDTSYIQRKLEEQIKGEPKPISSVVTEPMEKLGEKVEQALNGNGK